MSVLAIVLVVVGVLVALLVLGGLVASGRRRRADEAALRRQLEDANRALALAHAADRGWARESLEAAARDAFAERSRSAVRELQLVHVDDRPGTDSDRAVFRVITDHGAESLELRRHGDHWHSA